MFINVLISVIWAVCIIHPACALGSVLVNWILHNATSRGVIIEFISNLIHDFANYICAR